ncbi:YopX family protein [Terribacillus saccharophilus]|uniref:YopX family protein n=1 Tax=Terribacillus saccharophilus TaxID=361277 RepID=UPI003D27CFAD
MRTIKFRGMPIEDYGDTKWFYGGIVLNYDDKLAYIDSPGNGPIPVRWETVGEFTGLTDSNGREVYEGDIVNYISDVPGLIEFKESSYWITNRKGQSIPLFSKRKSILGNIHENPELLSEVNE